MESSLFFSLNFLLDPYSSLFDKYMNLAYSYILGKKVIAFF